MQQTFKEVRCGRCGHLYPDVFPMCPRCGGKPKKKSSGILILVLVLAAVLVLGTLGFFAYRHYNKTYHYDLGRELMAKGSFAEAQVAFGIADDYSDARQLLEEAERAEHHLLGVDAFERGELEAAIAEFTQAEGYADSNEMIARCEQGLHFRSGEEAYAAGDADTAIEEFTAAGDWPDAAARLTLARQMKSYQEGLELQARGDLQGALVKFSAAGSYTGTAERITECRYGLGVKAMEAGNYQQALDYFNSTGGYQDTQQRRGECMLYAARDYLTQGNYSEALDCYQQAKGHADALEPQLDNYILLCQARVCFSSGALTKGIAYFEQLPTSFNPPESDVATLRNSLGKIKNFANLEGTWTSATYDVKVSQVSGGWIYTNYYPEGSLKDQVMTIRCTLNGDGTVNLSVSAKFYYFTGYSYYTYFSQDHSKTVSFTLENLSWIPSSHKVDTDTIVYLSGAAPRLFYQKYVDGATATSNVTYDQHS